MFNSVPSTVLLHVVDSDHVIEQKYSEGFNKHHLIYLNWILYHFYWCVGDKTKFKVDSLKKLMLIILKKIYAPVNGKQNKLVLLTIHYVMRIGFIRSFWCALYICAHFGGNRAMYAFYVTISYYLLNLTSVFLTILS